ncbi:MAG: hypothetical protein CFE44_07990 [Burkholderiales bacterium PBB4]|nr:MAG: hypothetical protein CFE44_07990 [Burkholderiales bacterium PBB4]
MSTWVIDTNILEHLLFTAPAVVNGEGAETTPAGPNHDGHITRLLQKLVELRTTLAMDDKDRILGEYRNRLAARLKDPATQETTSRQLLTWAIGSSPKAKVKVTHNDGLMTCIAEKAKHAETSDKVIVYVAATAQCPLATNNESHINNVTKELKKCAKIHAAKGLEIYTSRQALEVVTSPEPPPAAAPTA